MEAENLNQTMNLLNKVKQLNESQKDKGAQKIDPSEQGMEIATLKPNNFRFLSPMLKARFDFAGHWESVYLSQNWLSLSEIASALEDEKLSGAINLQAENSYGDEPPSGVKPQSCAIFALNPYELETSYFVWSENEPEPRVWVYFGAEALVFSNFERYLEYILGVRDTDDSEMNNSSEHGFEIPGVAKIVSTKNQKPE